MHIDAYSDTQTTPVSTSVQFFVNIGCCFYFTGIYMKDNILLNLMRYCCLNKREWLGKVTGHTDLYGI